MTKRDLQNQNPAPLALMVQGATSDAGKSVFVAGLCRLLRRRSYQVAPFKPQNMALNSAVTVDGGEIGRAQAVQAQACGIDPSTDMNPILLKPNSDIGAQVIVHGKALTEMDAVDYHGYKAVAMDAVLQSWRRLQQQYNALIVEGAGSPAEINLRDNDIANMGFAEAVDCPVILIADIDRGGVFAHLVGTLELLSATERARIAGFVINKFRGDIALLQPGIDWLQDYTGKPVWCVLPYLSGFHLAAEDAVATHQKLNFQDKAFKAIVPVLSRISNHTDFDPLRLHPQIDLAFIGPGQAVPSADLIILPGSKNVIKDLQWLRRNHWPQAIQKHLRYGGKLLGICGGFQMLGDTITDPLGIEGLDASAPGLGLLEMTTELRAEKQLHLVTGQLTCGGAPVSGYEIHAGISHGKALEQPAVQLQGGHAGRPDGAVSADDQVMGTYLHGIFDQAEAARALLRWAGMDNPGSERELDYQQQQEAEIDRLANCIEQQLDLDALLEQLQKPGPRTFENFVNNKVSTNTHLRANTSTEADSHA